MSSDVYYAIEHERVRTLIARSGVLIACNPEDEWQIFGWLCYFPANVAHYCYVKSAFRRLGIARALVKEAGLTTPLVCTSTGRLFESWRQGGLVTFDPRWAR